MLRGEQDRTRQTMVKYAGAAILESGWRVGTLMLESRETILDRMGRGKQLSCLFYFSGNVSEHFCCIRAYGAELVHKRYTELKIADLVHSTLWVASPEEYYENRRVLADMPEFLKGHLPKNDCWSTHTHIFNKTVDCHYDVEDKGFTAQYVFGDFDGGGHLELLDLGLVLHQRPGTLTLFRADLLHHSVTDYATGHRFVHSMFMQNKVRGNGQRTL